MSCLIYYIPFRIDFAVPLSKSHTNGRKGDSYILKFPLGTVLSIEFTDDNYKEIMSSQSSLCFSRSPAIFSFLVAKYGVEELYPTVLRAHYSNLRYLTVTFFWPAMTISHNNDPSLQKISDARWVRRALKVVEESYIFLGDNYTSAVDFLAYSEIVHVRSYFGNLVPVSANISTCTESMKKLPYQDEFHVALKYIIGDLNRANDMKILKNTFTEANLIWLKEKQNIDNEKRKSKCRWFSIFLF